MITIIFAQTAHFIDVKLSMQDTLKSPLIRGQLQKVNDPPAKKGFSKLVLFVCSSAKQALMS